MSDSIWNYRDDIDPRPSGRGEPGRGDIVSDEPIDQHVATGTSGVPAPPPAAPTDAPLVDSSALDPTMSDPAVAVTPGSDAPTASRIEGVGTDSQGIEIIGYDVEASDGGLGKIDESSLEAGSAYVVVDTGWWIFGKKRMIPAGVIQSIDHENHQVFVGLTKDEIKAAPDFAEEHREDRSSYDDYYGPYGR